MSTGSHDDTTPNVLGLGLEGSTTTTTNSATNNESGTFGNTPTGITKK